MKHLDVLFDIHRGQTADELVAALPLAIHYRAREANSVITSQLGGNDPTDLSELAIDLDEKGRPSVVRLTCGWPTWAAAMSAADRQVSHFASVYGPPPMRYRGATANAAGWHISKEEGLGLLLLTDCADPKFKFGVSLTVTRMLNRQEYVG